MISLHGSIPSYFNESTDEIIPYITENKLESLQLLSIPPRNCVNWVSSEILDNVVIDCYHLYKREVPNGKSKGFLEKIDGVPLDKKIKKTIKNVYERNGFPGYFKRGYELKRRKNDIGGLQSVLSTDPINTAGFLTTYFWEKGFPYYINNYSIDDGLDGFSSGVVIMKDTNYYLAPNFYQIDGNGFDFLNLSSCPRRNYILRLCNDNFDHDKEGIEYYVDLPLFYTLRDKNKYSKHNSNKYLLKLFIDNDTKKVYIKQLAGYNFLSSPIFIHFIENYRTNPENYNFTDIHGKNNSLFDHFSNELKMCNSLSIPILKQLKIIPESSLNIELMLSTLYNFELNSWFENDGYVCYQGFFCRNFDIHNIYDMKYFYDKQHCKDDSLACKRASRNLPMSPRTIRNSSQKSSSSSRSSRSHSSRSHSSRSHSSRYHSSRSHSSKGHSSRNRPKSRNRRVLNAFGGK
jgi:hypothetical protein